jgi:hypothetical protein
MEFAIEAAEQVRHAQNGLGGIWGGPRPLRSPPIATPIGCETALHLHAGAPLSRLLIWIKEPRL